MASKPRGRPRNSQRRRRTFHVPIQKNGYHVFDGTSWEFQEQTEGTSSNIAQDTTGAAYAGGTGPTAGTAAPEIPGEGINRSPNVQVDTDVIEHVEQPSDETETEFARKRRRRAENWADLKPDFLKQTVINEYPATFCCCRCDNGQTLSVIYRCLDCGPHAYFCQKCADYQHEVALLHRTEVWCPESHHFEECSNRHIWRIPGRHRCASSAVTDVVIIDERGRQHFQGLETCKCDPLAVQMVSYGLWPASPTKPHVCFTQDFMENLRAIALEGQISVRSYVAALQQCRVGMRRSNILQFIPDIYRILSWDCILHYMWVRYSRTHIQFGTSNFPDGTECPVCPKDGDSEGRKMAMDGNFNLVHRAKAGISIREPLHKGHFFLPQQEVDSFVESGLNTLSVSDKNCSNFQATSVLRSKNKTAKLDVTGAFASVCSHDFPAKIFNIRCGEKMAYPIFMTQSVTNVSVWMYDIGCQLDRILQKQSIPHEFSLAVPIFHVFGHRMSCQVKYSPRCVENCGLADGEGTERLWSYLGKFNLITKEMKLENREDLLVEALFNYAERLAYRMGINLARKLTKAVLMKENTNCTILEEIHNLAGLTVASVGEWEKAERERAVTSSSREDHSWECDYVMLLFQYYDARESDSGGDGDLGLLRSLSNIEKKNSIVTRWSPTSTEYLHHLEAAVTQKRFIQLGHIREAVLEYDFLKVMKTKYASGQALAKRITKQLLQASKRVNTTIAAYNELPLCGSGPLPHRISREVVARPDAEIWQHLAPSLQISGGLPTRTKRRLIDLYRLNKRATEEVNSTIGDMRRLCRSLQERLAILQHDILLLNSLSAPDSYQLGTLAILSRKVQDISAHKDCVEQVLAQADAPEGINIEQFMEDASLDADTSLPSADIPQQLLQEIQALEDEGNNCDALIGELEGDT